MAGSGSATSDANGPLSGRAIRAPFFRQPSHLSISRSQARMKEQLLEQLKALEGEIGSPGGVAGLKVTAAMALGSSTT